jgi:hypothetical protein
MKVTKRMVETCRGYARTRKFNKWMLAVVLVKQSRVFCM